MNKICRRCKESKPIEAFAKSSSAKDGLQGRCKQCHSDWRRRNPEAQRLAKRKWEAAHPEEVREAKRRRWQANLEANRETQRQWRINNPEKVAEQARRRRVRVKETVGDVFYAHGITREQVEELLTRQKGLCALCGRPLTAKNRNVDHDHGCCPGSRSCGKCIRGLVCMLCNGRLGWYEARAARIAAYLAAPPAQFSIVARPKRRWTPPTFEPSKGWPLLTHCKKEGHELTPENLYVRANGERRCKLCAQAYNRDRWRAKNPHAPHRV